MAGAGYLLSAGNEQFAADIFKGLKNGGAYAKGGIVPPNEISLVGERGQSYSGQTKQAQLFCRYYSAITQANRRKDVLLMVPVI